MEVESQICHGCQKPKPLTKEFWYQNKSRKTGFATKCKICSKQYLSPEARLARAELRELAALDGEPEEFGPFGARALSQEVKGQSFVYSIYRDI